jgi:hypothetical protein
MMFWFCGKSWRSKKRHKEGRGDSRRNPCSRLGRQPLPLPRIARPALRLHHLHHRSHHIHSSHHRDAPQDPGSDLTVSTAPARAPCTQSDGLGPYVYQETTARCGPAATDRRMTEGFSAPRSEPGESLSPPLVFISMLHTEFFPFLGPEATPRTVPGPKIRQ